MRNAKYWIERLNLLPHPEGGYYREVYRSGDTIGHPEHSRERNLATSIYFLLEGENISHFHELSSDELWYYHDGKGANIHVFDKGQYQSYELSKDPKGQLQVLLPAHSEFAAEVIGQDGYVLMGCVVTPGFDFEDFRLLKKKEMLEKYPGHSELIERFCME